jgi:hypothetical protein
LDKCLRDGHGRYCGLEERGLEDLFTQHNAFATWVGAA